MFIVTPKGFLNIVVGEPWCFCLRLKTSIITKTPINNNITAVKTPMMTSTYSLSSFGAATEVCNS